MWIYYQSNGKLCKDNAHGKYEQTSHGYSGYGEGKNNYNLESTPNVGPIPCGQWVMGDAYTSKRVGRIAIPLAPHLHRAHSRTYFRIHGDSASHPGEASKGCIILPRDVRKMMSYSVDRILLVVA